MSFSSERIGFAGTPPTRVQRAELLMKNTDLSLEKIADMIGYHNTSNFYKAFRAWFGESPRTWQKSSQK